MSRIADLCQREALGSRQHAEAADVTHVTALGEGLRRGKTGENLRRQIVVIGANCWETTDRDVILPKDNVTGVLGVKLVSFDAG